MKRVLTAAILMIGSVCLSQTPPAADSGQAAAEAKPAEAKPEAAQVMATEAILMSDAVPYAEGSKIQVEVLQECTALGRQLADSTEKYGKQNGLNLVRAPAIDPAKGGKVLAMKIVSVVSARSIMAHTKSVAIRAELYKDGQLVSDYSPSRNSGGGVLGPYQSSCSVLERTVNTLGSDVARWLNGVAAR
jgi:hypothetical protein